MASLCRKFATLSLQISPHVFNSTHTCRLQRLSKSLISHSRVFGSVQSCKYATQAKKKEEKQMSPTQKKLMQFFDDEENWGKGHVQTGRPWKPDELRLKSYSDLHKLWYVLLKERNMLLTMEEEYKRVSELFPNPDRIYKVEESMENIVQVLQERNAAVQELEQGEASPEIRPPKVWHINVLGFGHMKHATEHRIPKHIHGELCRQKRLHGRWVEQYLRLLREKRIGKSNLFTYKKSQWLRKMRQKFPGEEVDA